MKKDDQVRVRALGSQDDWCDAIVAMISPNGVSVGLLLGGTVRSKDGFIGGALPLLIDQDPEQFSDRYGAHMKSKFCGQNRRQGWTAG